VKRCERQQALKLSVPDVVDLIKAAFQLNSFDCAFIFAREGRCG
jgi:hypothetical protein